VLSGVGRTLLSAAFDVAIDLDVVGFHFLRLRISVKKRTRVPAPHQAKDHRPCRYHKQLGDRDANPSNQPQLNATFCV
jgi:hypothetical protein